MRVPQYYLDLNEANAGKPTWRKEYAADRPMLPSAHAALGAVST